jgi:hypothetical protein
VISLGEFSHCGYKCFLKKLGKFCFNGVNSREKCWKNGKKLQTEKLRKKRKRKRKHW